MFDQITTFFGGMTGRLKNSPTLRKWFWPFVAGAIFTLIILGYNAFMSLNFYRKMLEKFADFQGDFLPYTVTICIALVAYFFISSITGTILDYVAGRDYKTKGHEPMFIAAIIGLIALLCLDIYANLQGVDYVAELTTEEVMQNPLDNIEAEYQVRRENAESEYKPTIAKHEKVIARIRDLDQAKQSGHNKVCRDVCPYKSGTGVVHWNGTISRFGHRLISEYQDKIDKLEGEYNSELAAIRAGETTKRETAKDDYSRDKSRFDMTVEEKQSGHRKMVWFAYALALVISFLVNHYCDRAIFVMHPDREEELIKSFHQEQANKEYFNQLHSQYGALAKKGEQDSDDENQIGFHIRKPTLKTLDDLAGKQQEDLMKILRGMKEEIEGIKRGKMDGGKKVNESRGKSTHSEVYKREIELNDTHPQFTRKIQPDSYRGIDGKKYKRFIRIARQVLSDKGRYIKAEIVRRSGMSKPTVNRYFKLAIEKRDLEPE